MDWTEKYRPRSLAEMVGNGPAIAKLREWATSWDVGIPAQRAVVLAGQPGTGKTSAALALARDMDWSVIELNASDARNADKIRRVATAGAIHQTFSDEGEFRAVGEESGRKLIVLDEADNLYERLAGESAAGGGAKEYSDRGGKTQIIKTIRETRQPIVLIVNDLYALQKGSGAALRQLALTIKFSKVNVRSIPKALERIAREENVRVDPPVLESIAARAEGDLRSAVRDLESLCAGRDHVTAQDLGSLGSRDRAKTVFDVVRHILKGRRLQDVRREVMDLDATPEDMVLWVDENLPKEYKDPRDLVAGYEMLSKADRFLGRTRRTHNYRLWSYAGDLSTVGVMAVRQKEYKGFTPLGFPQWLSKMSRSRSARKVKDDLADHLAAATHTGRRKARLEQVESFTRLFAADEEFAAWQTFLLDLSDEEVAVLLAAKKSTKAVQQVRERADRHAEVAAHAARARPAAPSGFTAFEAPGEDAAAAGGAAGQEDADAAPEASGAAADPAEADKAPRGSASAEGDASGDDEPAADEGEQADARENGEPLRKRPKPDDGQSTLFGF